MIMAAGVLPPQAAIVAQLLWQRGWRNLTELPGFLNPAAYQPTPASAFGKEIEGAIARLCQAREQDEKVAIWGDFDADGLTATAVLWEGLGQFFAPETRLRYWVPNRFTESHGLSQLGLEALAAWGCRLIVTCDTGSTAHAELTYAQSLGIDVIVTDHHALPAVRPPVVALLNPRQLPTGHPLANLSGVAVAYKLLEALYERLPHVPQQPLETLLDLVAIGLIADLVTLQGDCRYLTQVGLQRLAQQAKTGVRPGIARLLEFCRRTGDRPSDIGFGLGPRINAVSRIHGDARFGVELLTSRDRARAETLALQAELANTRRRDLQAAVLQQATEQLSSLDLSTTQVILLSDPQWSPGVLGLVASQIAQTYNRPTLLFQTDTTPEPGQPLMARGSARSVNQIDLYQLVQSQAHLLTRFGGHPFAAGMMLPAANLPLLAEGLNRSLRSQQPTADLSQPPLLEIDLTVTLADLGRDLFQALKLLEPYGMGNPVPRLLVQNVIVEEVEENPLKDYRGQKQRYCQLIFRLRDEHSEVSFPATWWGHRRSDLPPGRYDLVVELDVYRQRYTARVVDVRPAAESLPLGTLRPSVIVDQRATPAPQAAPPVIAQCPTDWADLTQPHPALQPLTLAYPLPTTVAPEILWQQWIGLAKYLGRTGLASPLATLKQKLGLGDRTLQIALGCLETLGIEVTCQNEEIAIRLPTALAGDRYAEAATTFLRAVQEENFRRQYFYTVPAQTIAQVLEQL